MLKNLNVLGACRKKDTDSELDGNCSLSPMTMDSKSRHALIASCLDKVAPAISRNAGAADGMRSGFELAPDPGL